MFLGRGNAGVLLVYQVCLLVQQTYFSDVFVPFPFCDADFDCFVHFACGDYHTHFGAGYVFPQDGCERADHCENE